MTESPSVVGFRWREQPLTLAMPSNRQTLPSLRSVGLKLLLRREYSSRTDAQSLCSKQPRQFVLATTPPTGGHTAGDQCSDLHLVIRPRSGWVAHVFHRAHTCLGRHAPSVMRPQGKHRRLHSPVGRRTSKKPAPATRHPKNTTSLNEGSTLKPLATRATTLRAKSRQIAQGLLAHSVKREKGGLGKPQLFQAQAAAQGPARTLPILSRSCPRFPEKIGRFDFKKSN
jgi:hypothetical protein